MGFRHIIAFAAALYAGNSAVEELTPETYEEKVYNSSLPAVVRFYAPWCRPCRRMAPMFEEACSELEGIVYCASYDTDQETENGTSRYGIEGVPSLAYYCSGEAEIERIMTVLTKDELKSKIEGFARSCR